GISVSAAMVSNHSVGERAASPLRHWGTISVAVQAPSERSAFVRLWSIDSPDITGDACISAELVRPPQAVLARAISLSYEAGIETSHRQWQQAFDKYLAAARLYDDLRSGGAGADARTEMAQLAHTYLRRDRDGAALLADVLSRPGTTDAETYAARLGLLANTLVERPEESSEQTRIIEQLLRRSARLFQSSAAGTRELPRISILEGFLSYRR